jgi:hypothetical protein
LYCLVVVVLVPLVVLIVLVVCVKPQYDIRTDKWEIAQNAMNYVNATEIAKGQQYTDVSAETQKGESNEGGSNEGGEAA